MKETLIGVSIVLALLVGGLIGYAIGVENIHKEAVASGQGHWVAASNYSVVFAWGPAPEVKR